MGRDKDGHTSCDSLPLRGGVSAPSPGICDRTVPISGPRPSEVDSAPSLSQPSLDGKPAVLSEASHEPVTL